MANALVYNDRLPGVLCETGVPSRTPNPLRLDVAGFVGFAERGPVDVPVLIEDFSQYRMVFGGDLPLALVDGRPVYAHLPRTVETFFENGGQRCYVVRVVGTGARANTFHLPGLLNMAGWDPVELPAAWPGRWSDAVSVGTSLRVSPLKIRTDDPVLQRDAAALASGEFDLPLRTSSADRVQPGDLLRVHVQQGSGDRYHVYARAAAVEQEPTVAIQPATVPVIVHPDPDSIALFDTAAPVFALQSIDHLIDQGWTALPFSNTDITWELDGDTYRLTLPVPSDTSEAVTIEVGSVLRLVGASGEAPLFITVQRVARERTPSDPMQVRLVIDTEETLFQVTELPAGLYDVLQVDLLSFDLIIREGESVLEVWRDLRFSPDAGFWQDVLMPELDSVTPPAFVVDDFRPFSLRLGQSDVSSDAMLLPVGMGAVPVYYGPLDDSTPGSKDGLDTFDPLALFLDDAFTSVGRRTIMATANDLLYLQPEPRRLRGIHSLLPIDELGMVAIPDLVHVGWEVVDAPPVSEPEPETPEDETPQGFHDCPPEAPVAPPDDEAMPVLMLDMDVISPPGIDAMLADLPVQFAPETHDPDPMLDVQRDLIRLCAARADLVAILSVPQHYSGHIIDQWHEKLVTTHDFYDGDPLSYAAAYHGWAGIREVTTPMIAPLRYIPPDGVVCGMIADREIQRGVWIAPANTPLHSIADLDPSFADSAWTDLYNRQVNVIRWRPGRYTLMSAMTLAHDRSLVQLSVRRLLIFIRKVALREGQRYVFETNNERFRALVQTYFERVLAEIQDRGGIQAFQVVTGAELNTPQDIDNGRFLIALKVAPTLPIEFITIVLLRSGNNGIDIFER